jgi:hypothetical protein
VLLLLALLLMTLLPGCQKQIALHGQQVCAVLLPAWWLPEALQRLLLLHARWKLLAAGAG